LEGSDFADQLDGDEAANKVTGNNGNDRLQGWGGADELHGGGADDFLWGMEGNDELHGDSGDDELIGDLGDDDLHGGDGNDALEGGEGIDFLFGGDGADTLAGGAGLDFLDGGSGNDTLIGSPGDDSYDGGTGIDVADFSYSGGNLEFDLLSQTYVVVVSLDNQHPELNEHPEFFNVEGFIAGGGNDVLKGDTNDNYFDGGAGADGLFGDSGDDTLNGGTGNDFLFGGDGDDLLLGGAGADHLDGFAGINTLSYASSATAVDVNLNGGIGIGGDAQGDTMVNISNVVASAHADTVTGNGLDNEIHGGAGDDTLKGLSGNDVLVGGAGADKFYGKGDPSYEGSDIDLVSYEDSTSSVTVDLFHAVPSSAGDSVGDEFHEIDGIIGTDFNDELYAGAFASMLVGGDGDDLLYAAPHHGGLFVGGDGNDTLSYNLIDQGVVIDLGNTITSLDDYSNPLFPFSAGPAGLAPYFERYGGEAAVGEGGGADGHLLMGIENIDGSDFDDVLTGDELDNRLNGSDGNDVLRGGGGNDFLLGSDAIDDFGSDVAYGEGGDDTLVGSSGSDTLIGGAGGDLMYGASIGARESQSDFFRYDTVADSTSSDFDTIVDFVAGADKIDLRAIGTAIGGWGSTTLGQVPAGQSGSPVFSVKGQVLYDAAAGMIFINTDNVIGSAEMAIKLQDLRGTLTSNDFLFV
jgi:Ca2+-binding RTX toxin-like protein